LVKGLVKGSSENGNAGDAADVAFERHLRDILQARTSTAPAAPGGAPGPACLDAETLAAWADGELGAHERAAAEAHAADCSRCQTLLAAMIRTAPPAPEATSWWRLPAVKWLAPLAAVATGLAVWAIVPNGRPSVLPAGIQTASQPAIQPSLQSSRQFGVQPGDQVLPRANDTASATASTEGRLAELKARVPALRGQEKQLDTARNGAAAAASASSMPTPVLSDVEADRSAAAQEQSAKAAAPFVRPAAPAATVAAPESLARTRREDAVIGAVLEIVSPDANSRWQIVPGGFGSSGSPGSTVRRSTDGGSSWETQQTGAGVTLVAGGSPSSSVCWLVGPGGIVLLQTDGRSWRRIGFPERVDLSSVRAVNEKTAAVTAVDGRTFSTSDGGLTWTRVPIPD
jgi:anti-sigma factor RsiW